MKTERGVDVSYLFVSHSLPAPSRPSNASPGCYNPRLSRSCAHIGALDRWENGGCGGPPGFKSDQILFQFFSGVSASHLTHMGRSQCIQTSSGAVKIRRSEMKRELLRRKLRPGTWQPSQASPTLLIDVYRSVSVAAVCARPRLSTVWQLRSARTNFYGVSRAQPLPLLLCASPVAFHTSL